MRIFLAPFVVFWALLAARHPALGIGAGLALSLLGNGWRIWRRDLVVLEIGGLSLFALLTLALFASPEWAAANALWLSFAGLGAISLLSVAFGHPWTADYSRAAYPDNAATPQFHIINAAITALWGFLFLAIGFCRWLGVSELVTSAIVVVGVLTSIFGPRLAIRYVLKRMLEARETYHWPAPAFARDAPVDCDVAVIGAGIGGLTAAALLADAGLKVMVFDHHVLPGGFCHTYLRKAHHDNRPVIYRFDAGPHDFSGVWPGGSISGLLDRLGVADRLQWKRVIHRYHLAGTSIDVPDDWHDYVRLLCAKFPGSACHPYRYAHRRRARDDVEARSLGGTSRPCHADADLDHAQRVSRRLVSAAPEPWRGLEGLATIRRL
jgi:hypothetical protein